MTQITTGKPQEEYLRILGKGMVTIPKQWRDELGLEAGRMVKAKRSGNKMIIEVQSAPLPYRIYSNEEIEEWLKEDSLPKSLSKKIESKLNSIKGG